MKLKHHDLHIPKDGTDPFVNCKLDRKKYAEVLTDIVSGYADGFVLAINNPWGEGKTTFVRMWQQYLENEEFKTLYFNAWENDFENDVLVALISELGEIENKPIATFNNVLDKAVGLTTKVLPKVAKHLVKKAIGNEAAEDIIEGAFEYGAEELKEQINNYTKRKKSIQDFKDNLEVFVNEAGEGKPIVFIIDELDRCRPNYAVQVLEQIKHLFTVPGIVFVLSIDKVQLGHAVRGVYGNVNIDADEYLRRFIDLEYSIPKPIPIGVVNYFYGYFDFDSFIMSEERSGFGDFSDDKLNFIHFSKVLLGNTHLSLRQSEKLFAHTRLVLNSFKTENYIFPRLLLLLIYVKKFHSNIISDIKEKRISTQQLVDKIEKLFPDNITDEKTLRPLVFTIMELAVSYHNFFNEGLYSKTSLYGEDRNTGDKTINLNSKFDKSDNKGDLVLAYESLRYKNINRGVTIVFILNKIELLEPMNF